MAKLKVLHLLKSLDLGGIENLALDFSRNASREDIEMHVICMGGGSLERAFSKSGAHFHRFPKMKFPTDMIDPRLVLKLRNYIRKKQINVVHSHFADEGLHMYLATKGLPNVLTVLTIAVDLRINRRIDNLKFRFLAPRVNCIVTPSSVTLLQIQEYGMNSQGNAHCIYNGIDPTRVVQKKPSTLRAELGIPEQAVVGGMIGNFYNSVRDPFTVVQALPEVIREEPQFNFVFAGGHYNQWIRRNRQLFDQCYDFCKQHDLLHRVHFPGLRSDTPNVLKALDIYVHSTNFDTFGIAPVEAMMNGLPVLGNNAAVFREISHEGDGMRLYGDKDPGDLSTKLLKLIRSTRERKTLGKRHRDHAMNHYSIDHHIKKMRQLYLNHYTQK